MVKYPDFLRHIVNTMLSELVVKRREILGIMDEARKLIAKAENKYRFSSFGGNPEKLADYISSDEFKLVIDLFKSVNAVDVLIEILEKTRKYYNDLPVVVEAINKRIEELRGKKE